MPFNGNEERNRQMTAKGLILFVFSLLLFNIGLSLHSVDKDVILWSSVLISLLIGPYVMSGQIFKGESDD